MFDADKKEFAKILRATMLTCGGDAPEPDVLRIWWASLQSQSMDNVREAFGQYAMRGKYAPKPADILEILDRINPDGRPGADEAWAMIPRDEYKSIVWTQEMAEAFGIAQPLLDEGDQVAARMAFKEAYARIVDSNKQHGISIKWFPSLGRDVEMRNAALTEAVRLGRIGVEHAASLLPPDQSIELLKNIKQSLAIKDDSNVKKIESLVDGLKLEKLL